jgi:hypothetical protein
MSFIKGLFWIIFGLASTFLAIVTNIWLKMLYGYPTNVIIMGISLSIIVFVWWFIARTIRLVKLK